jgi:hypothetical protein
MSWFGKFMRKRALMPLCSHWYNVACHIHYGRLYKKQKAALASRNLAAIQGVRREILDFYMNNVRWCEDNEAF